MKKLILSIAISVLIVNCNKGQSKITYSSSRSESDKKVNEHQIVYIDDEQAIEIKQSDEFKMSEDEQSIISLSNGAYIYYKKDGKRLKIENNEQNAIVYQFNGGEKKSKLSADEQKILSVVMKDLIAHGFGVKDRAERLYNKGGLKAILNEVDVVKGDYAKAKYFEVLFEKDKLSKPEIIQVFNQLSSAINSDYEKASLLKDFPNSKLMDADISSAYYTNLKSVNSDYEKAEVIKLILEKTETQEQFSTAFQFIENIESDYEKSEIIKSVIKNKPMSNEIFYAVLKASTKVESDYEVSGIYKKMIKKLTMTETQWLDCFTYIQKINSDYEKSGVLEDAYSKMPASEKVKKAFSDCAKTISSDHEYGKLMKSIQ
jgi:hypothetical protein